MKKTFAPLQACLFITLLAAPLVHVQAQTATAPDPLFQTMRVLPLSSKMRGFFAALRMTGVWDDEWGG